MIEKKHFGERWNTNFKAETVQNILLLKHPQNSLLKRSGFVFTLPMGKGIKPTLMKITEELRVSPALKSFKISSKILEGRGAAQPGVPRAMMNPPSPRGLQWGSPEQCQMHRAVQQLEFRKGMHTCLVGPRARLNTLHFPKNHLQRQELALGWTGPTELGPSPRGWHLLPVLPGQPLLQPPSHPKCTCWADHPCYLPPGHTSSVAAN